jgi:UDP-N-acetylglucosamine:LPS N-acetylglucosamine transferase
MGILAAQNAGMPSVLVENFTWDWIYKGYERRNNAISDYVEYLRSIFNGVNHHIQAEPVCLDHKADLLTRPVSRKVKTSTETIRRQLRIPPGAKVVLITMGGIPDKYTFIKELKSLSEVYFVVPGGSAVTAWMDNLVLLPHHSVFYHPDLVNASDAVIGKLGYSTLAEVYYAGVPFGYISRPDFRESERLAIYVERNMPGLAIAQEDFMSGHWISQIPELLTLGRVDRSGPNGSEQIANYICTLFKESDSRDET